MERFINAAQSALNAGNWYGALAVSLTLPDICGRLENPSALTKERYLAWWLKYCQPKYTYFVGALREKHVFLAGDDAYALRCAYLHEGGSDISYQRARKALSEFIFVKPPKSGSVHCNQSDDRLQLQVDIFCNDICAGATTWSIEHKENSEINQRIALLLSIKDISDGFGM